MYKNPIPVLPEDEKYKEFRIQFKYKEAMTTKEAAKEFFAYLMHEGELPEKYVAPIGRAIFDYQKGGGE